MKLELIAFTAQGAVLAARLAQALSQRGHQAACTRTKNQTAAEWTAAAFDRAQGLIFVGAAGIAVRSIAPWLRHKSRDPAVVVVDEGGQFAIPILSGHLGGANDLAREIAALLGGQAVITTATDVSGEFAVDQWARRQGLIVCNPENIVDVSSALLAGRTVTFWSRWPIAGELPAGLVWGEREASDVVTDWYAPRETALWLCPKTLRAGVGCRRGTKVETIRALLNTVLRGERLSPLGLEAVCSIDLKQDEPGLLALCEALELPLAAYTAQELAAVPGEFTPSPFVENITGVDNVCERAALAEGGVLLRKKTAQNGVTLALAGREPYLSWNTDGRNAP